MSTRSFFSGLYATRLTGLRNQLKAGLLVGAIVGVGTLLMPNHFKSQASILPSSGSAGGGSLSAIGAAFGVNIEGTQSDDANFPDILDSRWLKENLLRTEFQFSTRFGRFGAPHPRRETLYDYVDASNMDKAVAKLGAIYSVTRDIKTNVISITAETTSPELSQQIAQRATALLEQYVQHMSHTRSGEKADFAEKRLIEARGEMDRAEGAFLQFLEVNRNFETSGDPSVRLQGDRLERELKLRQDLVSTLSVNREQALLDAKNDVPVLNILDPGNLPVEKSGPSRSLLSFIAFLAVVAGLWGVENRAWIKAHLIDAVAERH